MFAYLIAFVFVISTVLDWISVSVTETIVVPVPVAADSEYYGGSQYPAVINQVGAGEDEYDIHEVTLTVHGLLTLDGIRFIFTSFDNIFAGFSVIAVTFIAMMGTGAAEGAGLMDALIRKLVASAPRRIITFLIPLAAVAFMALGRHPLASMAAGFAGVAATCAVNIIIQPTDAMITEIANEAMLLAGGEALTVASNLYFSIVSLLVLSVVATIVTERMIEPKLGVRDRSLAGDAGSSADEALTEEAASAEAKGLRYALVGFLGTLALVALITAPPGAPLRDPVTGDIIGNTPFMDSLLFIIALFFLVAGIFYCVDAGTLPEMQGAAAAYEKGWGHAPVFTRGGGSIPVVADITDLMKIPVVMMGYGLDTDGLHAPNEHYRLEMFQRGIETAIMYLEELSLLG